MPNIIQDFQNRVRRAGGLSKFLSSWIRSNFKPFWDFLQSIPVFKEILNKFYISSFLAKFEHTVPRIPRYTLKHDYPSMSTIYDESRTTYSRLLPRCSEEWNANLPNPEAAASLFLRESFRPETNRNINVLLAYYAQWFTHQFLNTNPDYTDEAACPLGINLSMMYGATKEDELNIRSNIDGLLRESRRNGKIYPEIMDIDAHFGRFMPGTQMFQMPISRANMVPGFAAIHILFFRHHQHIARELKKWGDENGKIMDDEELFQKTKLIIGLTVLKITMHDYVARSLQSSHVKIRLDRTVKKSLMWKWFGPSYFPPVNAIQVEFNFLYRWHQFIPETTKIIKKLPKIDDNTVYDVDKYDCHNLYMPTVRNDEEMDMIRETATKSGSQKLQVDESSEKSNGKFLPEQWNAVSQIVDNEDGLEKVLFSAASQRAGKLELQNTDQFLVKHVVLPGIRKNREYRMRSYNDYREYFGFGRVTSFEQITSQVELQRKLKHVYKHVDNIEYYPGVFAEDKDFGGVHGPLLATLGTAMTFGAIHASRLFESDIINEDALTPRGMELVEEIEFLSDLTRIHTDLKDARIRFTMHENAGLNSEPSQLVNHVRSAKNIFTHQHQD